MSTLLGTGSYPPLTAWRYRTPNRSGSVLKGLRSMRKALLDRQRTPLARLRLHLCKHHEVNDALGPARHGIAYSDVGAFRCRVVHLSRPEALIVITSLQNCITHCDLDSEAAAQGIRLLQDICSSVNFLPQMYWITDVEKGRRIAGGGEATIFKGAHQGRVVVIREFHPPEQDDWSQPEGRAIMKLVTREVIAHWQLRHPNVVGLLGIYSAEEGEPPSMVLQYASHASARTFLKEHPEPPCFIRIITGIIEGIHYLHSRSPPVIHGDLHDRNILVTSSGEALLCDFGLSRIRHEITRTHTTLRQGGRLRFVAPELSSGPESFRITEATDIYSLAMTIYALGTGSAPFCEYSNDYAASRAAEDGVRPLKPQSLGGLDYNATERLWSLLQTMWNHEAVHRPNAESARAHISPLVCMVAPSTNVVDESPRSSREQTPELSDCGTAASSLTSLPSPHSDEMGIVASATDSSLGRHVSISDAVSSLDAGDLSERTSHRRARNIAAMRAFRQRRERDIREFEAQLFPIEHSNRSPEDIKALQNILTRLKNESLILGLEESFYQNDAQNPSAKGRHTMISRTPSPVSDIGSNS